MSITTDSTSALKSTSYLLMLRIKTNSSVLMAGTDVPCNPLKLQNKVSLEKTLFFENYKAFYALFIKARKVSYLLNIFTTSNTIAPITKPMTKSLIIAGTPSMK